MKNRMTASILSLAAANVAGCTTFARIDGARTLPSNTFSLGVVAGVSDLVNHGSKCNTPGAELECGEDRSKLLKESPGNSPIEIQGTGRFGIVDRFDCGGAVSLGLLNGISADCKLNWFRSEAFATAVSLEGSNTWMHATTKNYKYITFESHFPIEFWLPLKNQSHEANINSLVMIVDPFGGYYWKNGHRTSFTAIELFLGVDGKFGSNNAQMRMGAFGWHATPHKMGGEVQGLGFGAQFNAPLSTTD